MPGTNEYFFSLCKLLPFNFLQLIKDYRLLKKDVYFYSMTIIIVLIILN